jgi:hypothetical protein
LPFQRGNGRSTFISALCLPRRPRQNDFLGFLLKRRATFSNSVAENALTLSHKIRRLRIKESDVPTKPLKWRWNAPSVAS